MKEKLASIQDLIDQVTRLDKAFEERMNHLIDITPTGELRNKLTELNIIHNACIMEITNINL